MGRMLATKYQSPLACPLTACAPIAIGAIAVAQTPRESERGSGVKTTANDKRPVGSVFRMLVSFLILQAQPCAFLVFIIAYLNVCSP